MDNNEDSDRHRATDEDEEEDENSIKAFGSVSERQTRCCHSANKQTGRHTKSSTYVGGRGASEAALSFTFVQICIVRVCVCGECVCVLGRKSLGFKS